MSNILKSVPSEFAIYTEWPEFNQQFKFTKIMHPEYIGDPRGFKRRLGPLCVETYITDREPQVVREKTDTLIRIIIWQPLVRRDIPSDWSTNTFVIKTFHHLIENKIGLALLSKTKKYYDLWAPQEQRRRRTWMKESEKGLYDIISLSTDEFWNYYSKSETWKKINSFDREIIRFKMDSDIGKSPTIRYRCVVDKSNNSIVAGLASIYSPSCRAVYYFIPFLYIEGHGKAVMTGLIDDLFQFAESMKCSNVQFGQFWTKGRPDNWRGFSEFKAKFCTDFIEFPPALVKFI